MSALETMFACTGVASEAVPRDVVESWAETWQRTDDADLMSKINRAGWFPRLDIGPRTPNDRRAYIGSADISQIVGVSPFGGPMDTYLRKCGLEEEGGGGESEHLWIGRMIEPAIAAMFADRTGMRVEKAEPLRHPSAPFLGASLDYIADGKINVECKFVTVFGRHNWPEEVEEVPQSIVAQTTYQVGIARAAGIHIEGSRVPRLLNGVSFRIYEVAFDEELYGLLETAAKRFWKNHVIPRVPPPLDGSEASLQYLRSRYPSGNGRMLPLTPDALTYARAYRDAQAVGKSAEAESEMCKQRLIELIGDADGISGVATWKKTKSAGTDWKALAEASGVATKDNVAKFTRAGHRTFRLILKEDKTNG